MDDFYFLEIRYCWLTEATALGCVHLSKLQDRLTEGPLVEVC